MPDISDQQKLWNEMLLRLIQDKNTNFIKQILTSENSKDITYGFFQSTEIVQKLKQLADNGDLHGCLQKAITDNNVRLTDFFLNTLNLPFLYGKTLFFDCVTNDRVDMAKLLLSKVLEFDPINSAEDQRTLRTLMHQKTWHNQLEMAQFLFDDLSVPYPKVYSAPVRYDPVKKPQRLVEPEEVAEPSYAAVVKPGQEPEVTPVTAIVAPPELADLPEGVIYGTDAQPASGVVVSSSVLPSLTVIPNPEPTELPFLTVVPQSPRIVLEVIANKISQQALPGISFDSTLTEDEADVPVAITTETTETAETIIATALPNRFIAMAIKEAQEEQENPGISLHSTDAQFTELGKDICTFNFFSKTCQKNPEIKELLLDFNAKFKIIKANKAKVPLKTKVISKMFGNKTDEQLANQAQKDELKQLVKTIKTNLDNLKNITTEEEAAIARITTKLTKAAEHTSHPNKTIKYLFNNMGFYENKYLRTIDANTFVLCDTVGDNQENKIIQVAKQQQDTKTIVKITLEDFTVVGTDRDNYLYQMVAYSKKSPIQVGQEFNIKGCVNLPLTAMKLYIFGLSLGFSPQLNEATKSSIKGYIAQSMNVDLENKVDPKDLKLIEIYNKCINVTEINNINSRDLRIDIKAWESLNYIAEKKDLLRPK